MGLNWGIQIGARVLSISKVLRKYEMKKKIGDIKPTATTK